jgi:uncharacterized ubiquitin-like protein YukD
MKIFIEINTIGNGKKYEFEVADTLKVSNIKERVIKEIQAIEQNKLDLSGKNTILCLVKKNKILSEEFTLKQQNIKSGDELLLL